MVDVKSKFQKQFDNAISTIEMYLNNKDGDEGDVSKLVEWMLTTDANSYGYLGDTWGGSLDTAENFASFLNNLHHALVDDGDVEFVSVNDAPRIVFAWRGDENFRNHVLSKTELDMEERRKGEKWCPEYEIKVLDISPNEFPALRDAYEKEWLKKCFLWDVKGKHDTHTIQHYSTYQHFNPAWIEEIEE